MSTNVTVANNAVEYHGVAHIQSMTQDQLSNNDNGNPQKSLTHDENGNFAKGNPGGPGRPPTKRISDAYRAILERDGAEKYAEVIAKDALEASRARDRLAAIQEISDRVEGKAVQVSRQESPLDENTVRQLMGMLDRLAPRIAIQVNVAEGKPQPIVVNGKTEGEGIMLSEFVIDNEGVK